MKTEGIVVFTTDYKETSKIVNLFTPNGLISVIAKGALNPKKGLLGFITTGNIVSFVTTDSNVKSLVEYTLIDNIYNLNSSLDKMKAFSVIFEIIRNIPNDVDNNKTYEFVKKVLLSLHDNDEKKVLSIFLIKMLYVFGIAPNLKTCVRCNDKNIISFSVISGGALCGNCGKEDILKLKIWKEYYFEKKDIKDYSDTDFNNLLKDIKEYYNYHMGINLKM